MANVPRENQLIGVIAEKEKEPIVKEFFELFKTPWEFCSDGQDYEVILTTGEIPEKDTKVIIAFGSDVRLWQGIDNVGLRAIVENSSIEYGDREIPINGRLLSFDTSERPILRAKSREKEICGITFESKGNKIFLLGYDLFQEVQYLLTSGQAVERAITPTLELHISLIRDLILQSGVTFIEIPPVPSGYDYIACMTHDVDFMGIRDHKLDRSVIGFVYRVCFPYSIRNFESRLCWSKPIKNLKALVSLPAIYLGVSKDFWFQLDRYMEIERDIPSTFFFIPVKGHPGNRDVNGLKPKAYRSAKYRIHDHKASIEQLVKKGCEIGVHGIDAWYSPEKGKGEIEAIGGLSGQEVAGVRMHWLYFSKDSPKTLLKTGLLYDSTVGYNNGVGYRCGTAQVFQWPGVSDFFELPLLVQDTALFYKGRMNLAQNKAMDLCEKIRADVRTYGGVFTLNWHQRSLGPERNWDDFYVELLRRLKQDKVWFATGGQAVRWFKKRRSVRFEETRKTGGKFDFKVKSSEDIGPDLILRIHHPPRFPRSSNGQGVTEKPYTDIPWSGNLDGSTPCYPV